MVKLLLMLTRYSLAQNLMFFMKSLSENCFESSNARDCLNLFDYCCWVIAGGCY